MKGRLHRARAIVRGFLAILSPELFWLATIILDREQDTRPLFFGLIALMVLLNDTVTRILLVDDYEPWRRFGRTMLEKQPTMQVVGETSDGLDAVQKAQELQPNLILLDIGLPSINGIEAARRIRQCAPMSKILFVSENRGRDIAQAALATGASGYVLKSAAARELLPAVEAVLQGKQFVSARLSDSGRSGGS